jgi:hypothetical protein
MKLVNEIIELASDGKQPLADVLRKCLILAFDLKNEKLKNWTERELNGFAKDDEVPPYRTVTLHSKGNFSGPAGSWIPQRPLPLGILEKKERDYLINSKFLQPIATYDTSGLSDEHNAIINWPPDLIVKYQARFIEGYALSQAWQEVPASVMVGLCEEVRNRVLRFALEIREEVAQVDDQPSALPAEKIEAAVINYIYGGVNVIGGTAKDFTQIGNIIVAKGDFNRLTNALRSLEVPDVEIASLKQALAEDGETLGQRTKQWLTNLGSKLGSTGLKIGATIAQEAAKEWLLQYCGLKQ